MREDKEKKEDTPRFPIPFTSPRVKNNFGRKMDNMLLFWLSYG